MKPEIFVILPNLSIEVVPYETLYNKDLEKDFQKIYEESDDDADNGIGI